MTRFPFCLDAIQMQKERTIISSLVFAVNLKNINDLENKTILSISMIIFTKRQSINQNECQ